MEAMAAMIDLDTIGCVEYHLVCACGAPVSPHRQLSPIYTDAISAATGLIVCAARLGKPSCRCQQSAGVHNDWHALASRELVEGRD